MNMKSNQVLLVAELEHVTTSTHITMAVTHLKAMPNKHETRLAQSKDLISKIKAIKCDDVIISGDFNYTPEESGYKYTCSQTVVPVKSVYGEVQEPKYTCQWVDTEGELHHVTVDYVWYAGDKLKVSGVYRTPENVQTMIYAPHYPSDHWPLVVDFTVY